VPRWRTVADNRTTPDLPELTVPHARAWRRWLDRHHGQPHGVWLALAKRGATQPTRLTYDEALEEALCYGWIDGQVRRADSTTTYWQRFTPRRPRSRWSQRNVGIADRLVETGRMQPAGLAEVERAKADGRWDAAYAGPAGATAPDDLAAALAAQPAAQAMFDVLTSQNRYAIVYQVSDAKRPETRARRIEKFVAMLARGETPYPQQRRPG